MTHLLLIYAASQLDQGFSPYIGRVEVLSCKADDLVKYLIVMCNAKIFVRADQRMTHPNVFRATVVFVLEVRGVNFVTSA